MGSTRTTQPIILPDSVNPGSCFLLFTVVVRVACAGIFKQSLWDMKRIGIGLSYRPARLHRMAELIP
jgi:hypothetical protein